MGETGREAVCNVRRAFPLCPQDFAKPEKMSRAVILLKKSAVTPTDLQSAASPLRQPAKQGVSMGAAECLQERFSRFMFWPRSVPRPLHVVFRPLDQPTNLRRVLFLHPSCDMDEPKAFKKAFYLQSRHEKQ